MKGYNNINNANASIWHIDDVYLTDIWKRIDDFNKGLEMSCNLPLGGLIVKLKQCWELLKNVLCDYSPYLKDEFQKLRREIYKIRTILYTKYSKEQEVSIYNDFLKYPKTEEEEKNNINTGIIFRLENIKIAILLQMAKEGNLLAKRQNIDSVKKYIDEMEYR